MTGCDAKGEKQKQGEMSIFRPPIVRTGTAALNRALFTKKVGLAAAAVQDPRLISHYRKTLHSSGELLRVDRISPIRPHPDQALADQGRKCLLLNPSIKPGGWIAPSLTKHVASVSSADSVDFSASDTWGQLVKDGVQKQELTVIPYELLLDYDYWNYRTDGLYSSYDPFT